jgi:hypothetical protein
MKGIWSEMATALTEPPMATCFDATERHSLIEVEYALLWVLVSYDLTLTMM